MFEVANEANRYTGSYLKNKAARLVATWRFIGIVTFGRFVIAFSIYIEIWIIHERKRKLIFALHGTHITTGWGLRGQKHLEVTLY